MTNAEARFNKSLRPRKPEGSLGRTAQDVHLDSHTAPALCVERQLSTHYIPTASVTLVRFNVWWTRVSTCRSARVPEVGVQRPEQAVDTCIIIFMDTIIKKRLLTQNRARPWVKIGVQTR